MPTHPYIPELTCGIGHCTTCGSDDAHDGNHDPINADDARRAPASISTAAMLLELFIVTIDVTGKEPSWHKMTRVGAEPVEKFANRVRDTIVHLGNTSKDLLDADVRRSAIAALCNGTTLAEVATALIDADADRAGLDLERVKRLVVEFDAAKISALALAGAVPLLIVEIERLRALAPEFKP